MKWNVSLRNWFEATAIQTKRLCLVCWEAKLIKSDDTYACCCVEGREEYVAANIESNQKEITKAVRKFYIFLNVFVYVLRVILI